MSHDSFVVTCLPVCRACKPGPLADLGHGLAAVRHANCLARVQGGMPSRSELPTKQTEAPMCASCGCGEPNEQHEDSTNITGQQIQEAASSAGISTEQAAQNMLDTVRS